jgi:WD40 repeat protein
MNRSIFFFIVTFIVSTVTAAENNSLSKKQQWAYKDTLQITRSPNVVHNDPATLLPAVTKTFVEKGDNFAIASFDTIYMYNAHSGLMHTIQGKRNKNIRQLRFDNDRLAVTYHDCNLVYLYAIQPGQKTRKLCSGKKATQIYSLLMEGNMVGALSNRGIAKIFTLNKKMATKEKYKVPQFSTCLSSHFQDSRLLSIWDNHITIWDIKKDQHITNINSENIYKQATMVGDDLVILLKDGMIQIWNIYTKSRTDISVAIPASDIFDISLPKHFWNNRMIMAGNKSIYVKGLNSATTVLTPGDGELISRTTGNQNVFVAATDRKIYVWDLETNSLLNEFQVTEYIHQLFIKKNRLFVVQHNRIDTYLYS